MKFDMYNSLNEITQADQLLQSLGLCNYSQIEPKKSWTKLLEESMSLITELPQELFILKNVFDCYLTEIIWLAAKDGNSNIASAAYPEVPGKVFVSTGVFYYVPPFTTFQKFSKYAAFENMMHECLHHRAEQIMQTNSILNHFMSSSVHIDIAWRNTNWSFSHSIQSYYVYFWILQLRQWAISSNLLNPEEKEKLIISIPEVRNILDSLGTQLCQVCQFSQGELTDVLELTVPD